MKKQRLYCLCRVHKMPSGAKAYVRVSRYAFRLKTARSLFQSWLLAPYMGQLSCILELRATTVECDLSVADSVLKALTGYILNRDSEGKVNRSTAHE